MKRLKIYSIAIFVIFIAGLIGVQLQGSHLAMYITDRYYREAIMLEREFEWLDVLNISGDRHLLYIFKIDYANVNQEEWNRFLDAHLASIERLRDDNVLLVIILADEDFYDDLWAVYHAEFDIQEFLDTRASASPKSWMPFFYPLPDIYIKWLGR